MKYLRKALLYTIGFVLLAVALIIFIWFINKDKAKNLVVDQLKKQIVSDLQIGEIDFSLFREFPRASVGIKDVEIYPSNEGKLNDPILKAGMIALNFNLLDIFRQQYRISNIVISDGYIDLKVFPDGESNFNIWRADSLNKSNDSITLDLAHIDLRNIEVFFTNYRNSNELYFRTDRLLVSGNLRTEMVKTEFKGRLQSIKYTSNGNELFSDLTLDVDADLAYDKSKKILSIQRSQIESQRLEFFLDGHYHDQVNFQLRFNFSEAPLSDFYVDIPDQLLPELDFIQRKGNLKLQLTLQGNPKNRDVPMVQAEFQLKNGKFTDKSLTDVFKEAKASGVYSDKYFSKNGRETITLDSFSLSNGDSHFTGTGRIVNPGRKPLLDLKTNLHFDLGKLRPLISIDTLEQLTGRVKSGIDFAGYIEEQFIFTPENFINSKIRGDLELIDMSFQMKSSPHIYHSIDGKFNFNNNDLLISGLTGNILDSDFSLTGYFRNIVPYLFLNDQMVMVNARLNSTSLDIADLLQYNEESDSDTLYKIELSENLRLELETDIKNLTFNKFKAGNVKGHIRLSDSRLLFRKITMNTMKGELTFSGEIDGSEKGLMKTSATGKVAQVDINELFYEFGNFGQQEMTDKNLRGRVTATFEYSADFSPYLEIDAKSVIVNSDLTVENGELIGYAPIRKIEKYVPRQDFEHIRFLSMENKIAIRDRVIHIPGMTIETEEVSINIEGTHDFDNHVDYHFNILLSDLTSKEKEETPMFDGNYIVDDGLGKTRLFLSLSGHAHDPKLRYDANAVKDKIARDLRKEKKNLKAILKEEFSWLSKKKHADTLITREETSEDFVIEWEENPQDTTAKTKKPAKEKPKKQKEEDGFIIDW